MKVLAAPVGNFGPVDILDPSINFAHQYLPDSTLKLARAMGANPANVQTCLEKNELARGVVAARHFRVDNKLLGTFPRLRLSRPRRRLVQPTPVLRPGPHGVARVILDANGQNDRSAMTVGRLEGWGPTGNPDYDNLYDIQGECIAEAQKILKIVHDVVGQFLQPGVPNPIVPMRGRLTSSVNVDPTPNDDKGFIQGMYTYSGKDITDMRDMGEFIYGKLRGDELNAFTPPSQTKMVPRHEFGHLLSRFINPYFYMLVERNPAGESAGDFFATSLSQIYDHGNQAFPAEGHPMAWLLWASGYDFVNDVDGIPLALRHSFGLARPAGFIHDYLGPDVANVNSPTLTEGALGDAFAVAQHLDPEHHGAAKYSHVKYLQTILNGGMTYEPMLAMWLGAALRRPEVLGDLMPTIFRYGYYDLLAARALVELGYVSDTSFPEYVRQSHAQQGVDATQRPLPVEKIMAGSKESIRLGLLKKVV